MLGTESRASYIHVVPYEVSHSTNLNVHGFLTTCQGRSQCFIPSQSCSFSSLVSVPKSLSSSFFWGVCLPRAVQESQQLILSILSSAGLGFRDRISAFLEGGKGVRKPLPSSVFKAEKIQTSLFKMWRLTLFYLISLQSVLVHWEFPSQCLFYYLKPVCVLFKEIVWTCSELW